MRKILIVCLLCLFVLTGAKCITNRATYNLYYGAPAVKTLGLPLIAMIGKVETILLKERVITTDEIEQIIISNITEITKQKDGQITMKSDMQIILGDEVINVTGVRIDKEKKVLEIFGEVEDDEEDEH